MKLIKWRTRVCVALTLTILSRPSFAMEFRDVSQVGGRQVIEAYGVVELEDAERFEGLANTGAGRAHGAQRPLLRLNSAGGHVIGGITLGMTIRTLGFDTDVEEGATCASACTFAFLGGVGRTIAVRSEALLRDWNIITEVSRPPEVAPPGSRPLCHADERSQHVNDTSARERPATVIGCFGPRYMKFEERIVSALKVIEASKRFPEIVAQQSRWVAFRDACAASWPLPPETGGRGPDDQSEGSAAKGHGGRDRAIGCLELAYEKRLAELEALVRYLEVVDHPEVSAGWKVQD